MKNKKLISAILAAASIAGGVVGAQAADTSTLEGKVDSYTSRVMQAETKIKDLQTKVDALDTTGIANNKAGIEANKMPLLHRARRSLRSRRIWRRMRWIVPLRWTSLLQK